MCDLYVCACTYMFMYTRVHICMYVCMYICIGLCVILRCKYVCACVHVCERVCTFVVCVCAVMMYRPQTQRSLCVCHRGGEGCIREAKPPDS